MKIPPPEHSDDLIEWSLGYNDSTMNWDSVSEVKKKRKNWKEFVSNKFEFISTQFSTNYEFN